jgi:hypothetical protein
MPSAILRAVKREERFVETGTPEELERVTPDTTDWPRLPKPKPEPKPPKRPAPKRS